MKLTFWGAAQQVTGSMFLLELDSGFQVLIDCGMDMDNMAEQMPLYPGAVFPFDASRVNVVILTHAHLDHSGKIPNLFREGFEGRIICTRPTMELTHLLLSDSAAINRGKVKFLHKKRNQNPGFVPEFDVNAIYLERHVEAAMEHFLPVSSNILHTIVKGLDLQLLDTGHLLGASSVFLEVKEQGQPPKRLVFSGDLGRFNYPLLNDPVPVPQADYVICETTYGGRHHQSNEACEQELTEVIRAACIDKPGKLILPAFSIGRTQAIIYTLNKIFTEQGLPPVPIYADSPLAQRSNLVYEKYHSLLNQEAQEFRQKHQQLFAFPNLTYVMESKESKRVSQIQEAAIYVSSSGMLEGGRIQYHIRNHLQNADCTIFMVGFSAEGTLGRRLLEADGTLRMGNKDVPVLAKVMHTDAFSGHGDQSDLLHFVNQQNKEISRIFLVHGEKKSMETFAGLLGREGFRHVHCPKKGEHFEL